MIAAAALILAHGNSEVGRRFSDSGKTVTVDKTRLSEASINNLQIAADGLKVFGGLPHHVPITSSFIKLGQSAHKNYRLHVDEEKKKEAEKKNKNGSNKRKTKKSKFRKKRRS